MLRKKIHSEVLIIQIYIWFGDILTLVGYLMSNLVYTYILDIYDFKK